MFVLLLVFFYSKKIDVSKAQADGKKRGNEYLRISRLKMRLTSIRLVLTYFVCLHNVEAFSPNGRRKTVSTHKVRRSQPFLGRSLGLIPSDEREFPYGDNQDDPTVATQLGLNRREVFSSVAATALSWLAAPILPVQAKGLVMFPLTKPLFNTYTFMRVGTTLLEEEDIWSTNPLFLTNRDDALSANGQNQVQKAAEIVWEQQQPGGVQQRPPSIVIHSLAAAAMDTANILQQSLQIGRDRIRPEFVFMDPRGIGKYDLLTRSTTLPAVWALDADEAGDDGRGGRPPANEDGTPNETLADQAIRLRQLFSVLESQYSGESIVLVFPDGTGPALLACMMAGIPFSEVHRLEFQSAQIRTNVTPEAIRTWYQASLNDKEADANYQQTLTKGREVLTELRSRTEWTNRRDEQLETERLVYEEEVARGKVREAEDEAAAEKQRQARVAAISSSSSGLSASTNGLALAGGIGVSLIGMTQLYRQVEFVESVEEATDDSANTTSVTGGSSPYTQMGSFVNITTGESETTPMTTSTTSMTGSPLYGNDVVNGINGDHVADLPSEQERKQVAAQAMEEYLDKDDGGDAWLSSLIEILDEDEDDDLATNETTAEESFS